MKQLNLEILRSYEPCYDPTKYLPEGWTGTVIDVLNLDKVPFQDRLWVASRTDLVSEKVMRLFAVWVYRDTLNWIKEPDPRSVEAANVAEKYALGEATEEQLSAAWSAARSAAESAARSAAESAARSAAESAAESAARSGIKTN